MKLWTHANHRANQRLIFKDIEDNREDARFNRTNASFIVFGELATYALGLNGKVITVMQKKWEYKQQEKFEIVKLTKDTKIILKAIVFPFYKDN